MDSTLLMYYQPELAAYSNVVTVEDAVAYLQAHSNVSFAQPDSNVDLRIALLKSTDEADVSGLNAVVRLAMSNQGVSPAEIDRRSAFFDMYQQALVLTSSNAFAFANAEYVVSPCNMCAGDKVRIVRNGVYEYVASVVSVRYNDAYLPGARPAATFVASNAYVAFQGSNDSYDVNGLWVVDVDRIAAINYARLQTLQTASNFTFDQSFNYQLYQMLYPDARLYGKEQCYLDYIAHRARGDWRVGFASDIMNVNSPIYPFPTESMSIRSNLYVGGFLSLGDGNVRCAKDIVFTTGSLTMSNADSAASLITDASRATSDAVPGDLSFIVQGTNAIRFGAQGSNAFMAVASDGVAFNGKLNVTTFEASNISVLRTFTLGSNAWIAGTASFCNGAQVAGALSADAVYTTSDVRTKTTIRAIASDDALARLSSIRGYTFCRADSRAREMGLLAHEVRAAAPEAVHTDAHGIARVAYGNLAALFVEAINSLSDRVGALERGGGKEGQ